MSPILTTRRARGSRALPLAAGIVSVALRACAGAEGLDIDGSPTFAWHGDAFLATSWAPDQGALGGAGFQTGRAVLLGGIDADLGDLGIGIGGVGRYDATATVAGARAAIVRPQTGGPYYYAPVDDTPQKNGHRGDVALLDAFLHVASVVGDDQRLAIRIGRHALAWGESLYFPANGIAGAQAPLDATRRQPVAAYGNDQLFLPVGQASVSWQPAPGLAIEAYYPFEYRSDIAEGGYADGYGAALYAPLSDLDPISRRAALGALGRPGALYLDRLPDAAGDTNGQFGLSLGQRTESIDYGLYVLRFTAKAPVLLLFAPAAGSPTGMPSRVYDGHGAHAGSYRFVYPGDIGLIGGSISGLLGGTQIGAELSVRHDTPLVSAGIVTPPGIPGAGLVPRGDTLHAQLSWNHLTPPLPLVPDGAQWTGEIAANDLLAVTANRPRLMPGRTDFAAAFRTVFEARFFQALPRVDITVPIGFGYRLVGRSAVDPTMNAGEGEISIGVTATLDQDWRGAVTFAHAIGTPNPATNQYYAFDPARMADGYGDAVSVLVERKF